MYTLLTADNVHVHDVSEGGQYTTAEEAIAAAKAIIDKSLRWQITSTASPPTTAESLFDSWQDFGDSPVVRSKGNAPRVEFSPSDYAKQRAKDILGGAKPHWLVAISRDDNEYKFVFEQARNIAIVGLFTAAATWEMSLESTGIGKGLHVLSASVIYIAAGCMQTLISYRVGAKVREKQFSKRWRIVLVFGYGIILAGIIAATVKSHPLMGIDL